MSKHPDTIGLDLKDWIFRQRFFFVATALLSAEGRVKASPKGGDAFRVLSFVLKMR